MLAPDAKAILCARVLAMRVEGKKPTDIAAALGVGVSEVLAAMRRIADDVSAETAEYAREVYALTSARYEDLYALCRKAIDRMGDSFDPAPVKLALQVLQQSAKLHGVERSAVKPSRSLPAFDDMTTEEMMDMARRYGLPVPALDSLPAAKPQGPPNGR